MAEDSVQVNMFEYELPAPRSRPLGFGTRNDVTSPGPTMTSWPTMVRLFSHRT